MVVVVVVVLVLVLVSSSSSHSSELGSLMRDERLYHKSDFQSVI